MKCLICGGGVKVDVTHGVYVYYKCQDCGTSQVLPQPKQEELTEYYRQFHLSATKGGTYVEFEDRISVDFPAKVDYIKKHAVADGKALRLLDVGCGKGFFVKQAISQGFNAEGIDVSSSAIEYATRQLCVNAKVGYVEDFEDYKWQNAFDVVTLWATIEHLPNPIAILKAIYGLLKHGGHLFLDTGLGDVFWERFLLGHSQWFDAPQHLFVFSQKGLAILLKEAGFAVKEVDTNWERNPLRKYIKAFRHLWLCLSSFIATRVVLGKCGFLKAKEEAKWPIGRLVSIVALKE